MIYDERQALDRLGLDSFGDMTPDRIPAFARLMPELDRQLALDALNRFPAYASMTEGIVNCFMDAARNAIDSGSESARAAAMTVQTAAQCLARQLENEELSWISRSDINDKLIELAHIAATLDKNQKSFLLKLAGIAGTVITAVAGAAALILTSKNRRR